MIPTQIARVLSVLTAKVDPSSEEGRSMERHRRLLLSALASAMAKALSVATALISVPLTLHYLGAERYGMWMTMTSLITMLTFADLGMGNGLLNAVAAANGRDDQAGIKGFISSAAVIFTVIAVLVMALFALIYPWIHWPRVFNVSSDVAANEAGPATAVFLVCFAAAIPIGIVQRVQMALQSGYLASVWQCLGSLAGLLGVLVAVHTHAGLMLLVAAYMGLPLLVGLLNGIVYFGWVNPDIRPDWSHASKTASREIFNTGILFLVLQVVVAVAYTSDGFVIAQVLGPEAVLQHSVPDKMFSVVANILTMMLAPLWPAYGEALARGDHVWVRSTLKKSLMVTLGTSLLMSICLVAGGVAVLRVWVGESVHPSLYLLLGLGVWKIFETSGNAVAAYLNGAHVVRAQVFIAITTALAALSLKLLLLPKWGVAAVPWSTATAYFLFAVIPYAYLVPKLLAGSARHVGQVGTPA